MIEFTGEVRDLLESLDRNPADELSEDWKRTRAAYLSVFGTEKGERVLADILRDLRYFEAAVDPAHIVLQGFAKQILTKLGALTEDNLGKHTEYLLKLARVTGARDSKE